MPGHTKITIRSESPEKLRELIRQEELDLNCGGAKKTADGKWTVEAFVADEVIPRLRQAGVTVDVDREFTNRSAARRGEVGRGDRFKGGRTPPRGIGKKE